MNIWTGEARVIAELCNGDIEATTARIAAWMETAADTQRDVDYYRSLVERCGEAIGEKAYTQDDGGIVPDVLCAKVPELVEEIVKACGEFEGK